MSNVQRETGVVKFYNKAKGFGFIVQDDERGDLFFHATNLSGVKEPKDGDKVEYEAGEGKKGPAALNVVLI